MDSLQHITAVSTLAQPGVHIPWSALSEYDGLDHYFYVEEGGRLFLAGGEEVLLNEPARIVVMYSEHHPDYVITEAGRVYSNARSIVEPEMEVDEYGLPIVDEDADDHDDLEDMDVTYSFLELSLPEPVATIQTNGRMAVFLLESGHVHYWDAEIRFPAGVGRVLFGRANTAAMMALQRDVLHILTRTGALYHVRISSTYHTDGHDLVAARSSTPTAGGRAVQAVCIYASSSQFVLVDQTGRMYVAGELWYGNPGYTEAFVEVPVPEPLIDLVIGRGYTIGLGLSGAIYYAGRTTTAEVLALLANGEWQWW